MPHLRTIALTSALLGLTASATLAQSGNASDVTGAPITSGAIVGGSMLPLRLDPIIRIASQIVRAELNFGALSSPRGIPISTSAQSLITAVVGGDQAAVVQFRAGLSSSGAPNSAVTALSNALLGLMIAPTAQQIVAALTAWNAVVDASTASFLDNPSPEFEATAALMASYSAALKAQLAAQ